LWFLALALALDSRLIAAVTEAAFGWAAIAALGCGSRRGSQCSDEIHYEGEHGAKRWRRHVRKLVCNQKAAENKLLPIS